MPKRGIISHVVSCDERPFWGANAAECVSGTAASFPVFEATYVDDQCVLIRARSALLLDGYIDQVLACLVKVFRCNVFV